MADFRIWGTVTQTGPQEFVVVVCAATDGESMIERDVATSRSDALRRQPDLAFRLIWKVVGDGGRVTKIEYAE